jgi:hypothetical protein
MTYAEGTQVSAERSQAQISETLRKYGATGFMYGWEGDKAVIGFVAHGKHIRFILPLPTGAHEFTRTEAGRSRTTIQAKAAYEQEIRRRWRALLLAIKAKLEAVESAIATFEEEFLAHIVMPDGATVADHLLPQIEQAYATGKLPPRLLPALTAGGGS